jgi:DNA-binding NarL/FixJ family response regulator
MFSFDFYPKIHSVIWRNAMVNALLEKMTETQTTAPIKTAVIEDQIDIREGLASLIGFTEGFKCTGAYQSMEEALDRIKMNVPDVVLSDIGLPGMVGIQGIKILKEKYPNMLILMLTVYDDDERIFDALCGGKRIFAQADTAHAFA